MSERTVSRLPLTLLKVWHAVLAGAFLVAYATADENTYAMHQFAGYTVLAAIIVRFLAGLLAPSAGPWRLPRPSVSASLAWLKERKGRHPLLAWFAAILLIVVGMAAAFGAVADWATWMEHPHEAVAEASMWVIAGHVAFVTFLYGVHKRFGQIARWLARRRPSTPFRETDR